MTTVFPSIGDAHNPEAVTRRNQRITVTDSILWADRAHPLLIGPEGATGGEASEHVTEDIVFQNLDILRSREANPGFFGALAIMASDGQTIRNVRYQDIRVAPLEAGNLVDIRFVNNVYTQGYGRRIENIIFRNVTLQGPGVEPNRVHGHDAHRRVRNVVFENLIIDDRTVRSAEQGGFDVNAFADDVRFKQ